ncbi:hypothetical protein AMECASPLE_006421 [Ameca splendens]|uniref:Uncharacterized protein n=1 Tax=Ameca splendens TaxID=208324 RepID=A0ABV0XZ85_9TELE
MHPTQKKSIGKSQMNQPVATVQKAATSPQAPPAAGFAGADPAMDPEIRDLRAHYPPAEAQHSQGVQVPPSSHWEWAGTHQSAQPRTPRTTNTPTGRDTRHRQGV